jgi:hypothetical protein
MKHLRGLLVALAILTSGTAWAYDSFTVGLQGEVVPGVSGNTPFGINAHAVLPVTRFSLGSHPAVFSVRADLTASLVPFAGLAAVVSGAGSEIQPFISLGAGAALPGGPPLRPALQGLLGVRMPLEHSFYAVVQFQLRVTGGSGAFPGVGFGVEYSF